MTMISTEVLGFSLLSISLVFLGTWPALLRLCSTPPVHNAASCLHYFLGYASDKQQHPCRDTRFAYLDYALSYVVSSSLPLLAGMALAAVSRNEGEDDDVSTTITNSSMPSLVLILFALLGGSLLSMGNLSMQWATTIFGAPLTTVLALQASLTVVVGTSINFMLQPDQTARPDYLAAGVVVFLAAIGLATRAQLLYGQEQRDHEQKQHKLCSSLSMQGMELKEGHHSYGSLESDDSMESTKPIDAETAVAHQPEQVRMVDNLLQGIETHTQTDTTTTSSPQVALAITIFGGCCFGFFSPAFNIAVNDPFQWTSTTSSGNELRPLSVPVANLWFSLAFCLASFAGNIPLMYHPPAQSGLSSTTLSNYFSCQQTPLVDRKLALLAGFLCGWANLLQFQGGSLVGFATADLVQAFPLVSTIWDICLFGEFRRAGSMVVFYIVAMYTMYLCGIGFLITSSEAD